MEGQTVSHYRILEKIGEGGMGQVYLAEDTSLERKVALKFLPVGLQTDPGAHKRFIREAKSAAAIEHPYICNIKEVSQTEDGQDFIVMEHVEGQTLKDRLEEGQLPIKEALQIGSKVAEALEQAHSKGVVHRDLKPSNIMLTPTGHAKVLDFGLAKRITRDKEDLTSVLTKEGTTLGTLAYMSPEQLKGSKVDTRSDVFSLGVVLYEMLTGIHPFSTGTQAETVNAILSEHPSHLNRYVQNVPERLQITVENMLAKQPGERYQTVHEIRTNLTKVMEEITSPTPVVEPAVRKRNWLFGALSAIVAVAALALIWVYFSGALPRKTATQVEAKPLTSQMKYESTPSLSPDGNHVVYVKEGDLWVKQIGVAGGQPNRLTDSGENSSPVWSPDGKSVAFLRGLGFMRFSIHTVPGFGGVERQWIEITIPLWPVYPLLGWTPDSKSLVVAGFPESDKGNGLFLLYLETRQMRRLTTVPYNYHADFAPVVSVDGRTLAFNMYQMELDESGTPVGPATIFQSLSRYDTFLGFSPDGRTMIYAQDDQAGSDLMLVENFQ